MTTFLLQLTAVPFPHHPPEDAEVVFFSEPGVHTQMIPSAG
jgi:hypothetical protein